MNRDSSNNIAAAKLIHSAPIGLHQTFKAYLRPPSATQRNPFDTSYATIASRPIRTVRTACCRDGAQCALHTNSSHKQSRTQSQINDAGEPI